MESKELTKRELRAEFKTALEEVLQDGPYVSKSEAESIINRRVAKATHSSDEEGKEEEEEETTAETNDKPRITLQYLEEMLPPDLYEAARAYLTDETDKDLYLGKMSDDLHKRLAEQRRRTEERDRAALESAASDVETPVLDATIYDEEVS
jgi:hypothetical protein